MSETFENFTIHDALLANERENSPNVPFGDWVFVISADGKQPLVKQGISRDGLSVQYYSVVPYGKSDATPQWVYINALASDTALGVIFDANEFLKARARFGIYNKNGLLIVSADPNEVKQGIVADVKAYNARRGYRR
jgi:hypothetical protein